MLLKLKLQTLGNRQQALNQLYIKLTLFHQIGLVNNKVKCQNLSDLQIENI